jgi:hypothetical protein
MFASKDIFLKSSGGAYQISRSVRLRASATAYFNRTPASATNRQIWTWSAWTKLGSKIGAADACMFNGGATSNDRTAVAFASNDRLHVYNATGGSINAQLISTAKYRDPSAWYHIVVAVDTTQATSSNRIKIYVNGIQLTAFDVATYPSQNLNTSVNNNVSHTINTNPSNEYWDGYLTEINFIDGQSLTPSSFGETNAVTGVWQPKKYAGTYGTNGFYLNFSDNSGATATTIGKDYSGNGNNWTPNNISVTAGATYDSMLDVPTPYADGGNGRGNYCVLNPLASSTIYTISKANLQVSGAATSSATHYCHGTLPVSTGKWYFEVTPTDVGGGPNIYVGVKLPNTSVNNVGAINTIQNGYGYGGDGTKISSGVVAYGATYTNNDVVGVALNLDAGTIVFYKNNVSQGTAFTGLTGEFVPVIAMSVGGTARTIAAEANFGQRPFTYTPPTGFVALNTQNLPTPTISNGASYMAATTYTGTGSALSVSNAVNGISFQPDFVWTKPRSTAVGHTLFDSLRGVTKYLQSNTTGAEGTAATSLTAFNSDGFTVNSDTSTGANGVTYIGWQWNAGGSTVTNTSGTISAQVRANPTAGFSVVTYTGNGTSGATVGHGLGVAPAMMIVKNRSSGTEPWRIYHKNMAASPATVAMNFDTGAASASSTRWNNTAPTSSVFTVGNDASVNANTNNYVAYLFAAVAGYSAFGSYTGNGSADGPFVYTGFRPRFVMFKKSSAAEDWVIFDTTRNASNLTNLQLYPNLSAVEATGVTGVIDILSNGFKIRGTSDALNTNGGTYIFMAVAENPFKLSLAR